MTVSASDKRVFHCKSLKTCSVETGARGATEGLKETSSSAMADVDGEQSLDHVGNLKITKRRTGE
jgi:hypothetical protein